MGNPGNPHNTWLKMWISYETNRFIFHVPMVSFPFTPLNNQPTKHLVSTLIPSKSGISWIPGQPHPRFYVSFITLLSSRPLSKVCLFYQLAWYTPFTNHLLSWMILQVEILIMVYETISPKKKKTWCFRLVEWVIYKSLILQVSGFFQRWYPLGPLFLVLNPKKKKNWISWNGYFCWGTKNSRTKNWGRWPANRRVAWFHRPLNHLDPMPLRRLASVPTILPLTWRFVGKFLVGIFGRGRICRLQPLHPWKLTNVP